MKPKTKKIVLNLCILLIPVLVILALTPILPARIPIHWESDGTRYISKQYAFLLGLLPFVIYKLRRRK